MSLHDTHRELRKSDSPGVTPVGADAWEGPSRFIGVFVNHQQTLLTKLHQALATLELQRTHHLRALTEDALPRGPVGMETDMTLWGSLLEMATSNKLGNKVELASHKCDEYGSFITDTN